MTRPRRLAAGLAVVAAAAIIVVGPPAPAQPSSSHAAALLRAAADAATRHAYAGVLTVRWTDQGQTHQARTAVHLANGAVEVGTGDQRALSMDGQRWVGTPGSWTLVLGTGAAAASPPRPTANWNLQARVGPVVAGEATTVVVASDPGSGAVRARFYVDEATGLLLRREILDPDGRVEREVTFDRLVELGPVVPPLPPTTTRAAEPTPVGSMPSGYPAPRTLGHGYRLLGRYRLPDGTIQLYYGDGLFTLSLFEQKGTIDWGEVPPGQSEHIGGVDARLIATPTTSAVVWEARGIVTTCVSDAPSDQVLAAVRDLVDTGGSSSVGSDIAHFVLGPFGWN